MFKSCVSLVKSGKKAKSCFAVAVSMNLCVSDYRSPTLKQVLKQEAKVKERQTPTLVWLCSLVGKDTSFVMYQTWVQEGLALPAFHHLHLGDLEQIA